MNKLSFLSSIPSNKDTYIYVLPTNSQKSLNLDEVSVKVHILDLRGNSLLVFPAAGASSDGVSFTLSNLANLGSGTYAIYLELLYAHHQEFYPNDSVKYITVKNDDSGNLTFVNMFTAESSSIVPPQDTKSDLTDVLHVHDIDLKSIETRTVPDGHNANVTLDQNDNLIFEIPKGPKGDTGPQGPQGIQGPKGDKGDKGDTGTVDNAGLTTAPAFVSLQTQVNNSAVGTNLLTGTSSDLKTQQITNFYNVGSQATNGSYKIKVVKGQTYTYRAWLDNTNGTDDAFVNIRFSTTFGNTNGDSNLGSGTIIKKGETGYSTYVFTPTEDEFLCLIPFAYDNPETALVGWKEEKLEKGSVATDWCPNPTEILTQADRGSGIWAMKMTAGGNVSGRYITDLYNASATNLPSVNDLVIQPDGNVFSVTNVVKDTTPGAGDGGGTFDIGPALFSIKGNTPSEDDILAKTKQYVDDAILNGKW